MRLGVALDPDRGVLVLEAVQRVGELVLVALGVRLDRDGEDGLGGSSGSTLDLRAPRAEDVAGRGVGELRHRGDVAGRDLR